MTEKPTFKTAEELGITQDQFCALVKVAEGLQDGTLKHIDYNNPLDPLDPGAQYFDMSVWDCGSVCCIGGWSEKMGGLKWSQWPKNKDYMGHTDGLKELFYPNIQCHQWADITSAEGAKAVVNYLTTGDTQWRKVVGVDK